MSKRTAAIILIVLALIGSITTFYGLNLLFSDMANMFMSSISIDLLSSFPGFIFSLDFILATIYVFRYVSRPQYKKRMTLLYCIILGCFSFLGILTTILTGVLVYPSLLAPYPFKGYMIICLILHILLLLFAGSSYYCAYKHMPEDEERRKLRPGYVCYTIFLSILICFALSEKKREAEVKSRIFPSELLEELEIRRHYAGYIRQEEIAAERAKRDEKVKIPHWLDYDRCTAVRYESREKLKRFRPETLAQAARISGVNPADIAVLAIIIKRGHV